MKKQLFISLIFWSIVLIVGYFLIINPVDLAQATDSDTASTTAEIGNATPTITINSITSPVTLTEEGWKVIFSTSTVTDTNGCDDLDSVIAVFYDDTAVNNDCSSNYQNCYTSATTTCTATGGSCTGGVDTDEEYTCSATITHYANGTTGASAVWKWYISAYDGAATGTQTSNEVTINDLLALDVTEASIPYGTLALAATSSQKSVTVKNTGNKNNADTGIKESSTFTCTPGTIPPANQHYSTTTGFEYASGTALSTTTATLDINISQGSDATTTPSQPVYWLLVTPSAGVAGACNGQNYFEAQ